MTKIVSSITAFMFYTVFVIGATLFVERKYFPVEPVVKIVEKTKTVHTLQITNTEQLSYTQQYDVYKECFFSPIEIEGIMRQDNILSVTAGNKCQKAERDFKLGIEGNTSGNWKTYAVVGGVGLLIGGATILYLGK